MKVAVINCGSSSIKYEVFGVQDLVMLASGLIEKIGTGDSFLRQRKYASRGSWKDDIHARPVKDHKEGFDLMAAVNKEDRIIKDDSELLGIGHRVVHGGDVFREPTVIDDGVIEAIRMLVPLAPLHNPSNILGMEAAAARFPDVPQVAVFDTAFHHTIPDHAFLYALPISWHRDLHIRRYGFHGPSHFYVSREAARYLGEEPARINLVTLHLGNGASAAAIRGGESIDTSMGMTPLEGLVMGTRSGDIDPALHFYVMRQTGMSPDELERSLNSQSGLKGICGVNDMREILDQARKGQENASLALRMFCYRIKKYIGAYMAVLGRVDALVFTGGIGENSTPVRSAVCKGLEHLGIIIDEEKNMAASGNITEIQKDAAPIRILVVKTDEEREIARQTVESIANGGKYT
ncbi:MAG: acetate kinase [Syntrophorhabdus sp.]